MAERSIPKLSSTVLWAPMASVLAPDRATSVHAPVTALKLRRVRATEPATAVCVAGALSLAAGAKVTVTAAALRLRRRRVTVEPVRPKSKPPLLVLTLSSKGA